MVVVPPHQGDRHQGDHQDLHQGDRHKGDRHKGNLHQGALHQGDHHQGDLVTATAEEAVIEVKAAEDQAWQRVWLACLFAIHPLKARWRAREDLPGAVIKRAKIMLRLIVIVGIELEGSKES